MTCNVKGCENPDITSFKCEMSMDPDGHMEIHDVKVCTEHEKGFLALYGKKDRFYN